MSHWIKKTTFNYDEPKIFIQAMLNDFAEKHGDGGNGLPNAIEWIENIVYPNYDLAERAIDEMDKGNYSQIAVPYMALNYDRYKDKIDILMKEKRVIYNEIKERNSVRCKGRFQKLEILERKLQRFCTKKEWLVKIEFYC